VGLFLDRHCRLALNARSALETIDKNEEFIKMILAVLMTLE
jgi:hypothetical protein